MNKMTIASSLMSLSLLLAGGSAFAMDEMKKDEMGKDGMMK
jgi:pentapeptide MXKDX repeat protein